MYYVDVAIFMFQLPVEKTDGMVVVEVSCTNFTSKVYAMHCVEVFLIFFHNSFQCLQQCCPEKNQLVLLIRDCALWSSFETADSQAKSYDNMGDVC